MHQNSPRVIYFFKNFPGMIPRTPLCRGRGGAGGRGGETKGRVEKGRGEGGKKGGEGGREEGREGGTVLSRFLRTERWQP
jgi:hypothetical protein